MVGEVKLNTQYRCHGVSCCTGICKQDELCAHLYIQLIAKTDVIGQLSVAKIIR